MIEPQLHQHADRAPSFVEKHTILQPSQQRKKSYWCAKLFHVDALGTTKYITPKAVCVKGQLATLTEDLSSNTVANFPHQQDLALVRCCLSGT